jgi:uncharacterized protein GlcG (DUF336 family)
MTEQEIKKLAEQVIGQLNDGMTLDLANALIEKVKEKAREMGVNAVIAVSNAAAQPVAVQSMNGAYIASYDIAVQKAFTVVSLKMSTSTLKPLAQPGGSLYGIQFTNAGKIVVFGGGEPLKNPQGEIIGGIGVSGGSEEQDTKLAAYGKEIFEKGQYL